MCFLIVYLQRVSTVLETGTQRPLKTLKTKNCSFHSGLCKELQTFRTQDFSFLGTKGPYGELSFPGLFVPRTFHSSELSFVSREGKCWGTFVPGPFRSCELSFSYLHAQFYNSSLGLVIV